MTPSRGAPEQIAAALREIGPRIAPPETLALYAPLHRAEPYRDVSIVRDVPYGTHERQVLDVFMPAKADVARPVIVFLPGGA